MFKYLFKSKRKHYYSLFIAAIFCIILVSVFDIGQGILFMVYMNRAIGNNNYPVWALIVAGIVFAVVYYLISLGSSFFMAKLLKVIRREIVFDSLTGLFNLPVSKFVATETSSSVTNFVTTEIDNLVNNYYSYVLSLFGLFSSIVLGLVYLSTLSFYFIIPILILMILIFSIILSTRNKIANNYASLFGENKLVIKMMNNISNFFIVSKMYSYKKKLFENIENSYEHYNKQKFKCTLFDDVLQKVNSALSLTLFLAIYIIAMVLCIEGKLDGGEIVAVIQVCSTVMNPFFVISLVFRAINNTKKTRTKIKELIAKDVKTDEPQIEVETISGKNINFGYNEDKKVIEDLNFEIHKNDMVGIIGESGAGKSTLLKIISKVYDNYQGEIDINNSTNLKEIGDSQYYRNVKLLEQTPVLLNASFKDNVIMNNPYDEEKFNRIIKLLRLDKTFGNLPDKYETTLDSEENNYSLGEARRIAIARILYSEPDFMLLDEPFASLDDNNRIIIEEALMQIKDRCIIIASHQFSVEFYNSLNNIIQINKL